MRWFVARDLDGFFGLFVDNLVQLLLIVTLCQAFCGMTGANADILYRLILPGAAVSVLVGNVFYAWQALRLARRENRDDVTALPYGINTPSLLVYVFFVMKPVYDQTGSARLAWQMGLLACLGSGVIELAGSFVAERVRRHTPRAALLSTLAGIAIGFISMTFALQIWARPLLALLAIVLVTYFSGIRFPRGIPGGLVAILVGTLLAWLPSLVPAAARDWLGVRPVMDAAAVAEAWGQRLWTLPVWCGGELWAVLRDDPRQWLGFVSVILPMGLFNVIGSLQNIESAEAAGDRHHTAPALAVNGVGTILAALFGSCFPTTIYIGHLGWKGLGARAGYSILNGAAITAICLTGTLSLVKTVIPIEAGIGIVLWIGIVITAQAFQATPARHAPAVAVGLFPAIAAWGAVVMTGAFLTSGGTDLQTVLQKNPAADANGFLIHGLLLMERGYIFTCMILAAVTAFLIDRRFLAATAWSLLAGLLTFAGLIHAYRLTGNTLDYALRGGATVASALVYRADDIAVGYALMALIFLGIHYYHRADPARVQDH